LRQGVDAVTFFSPSAVEGFAAALTRGDLDITRRSGWDERRRAKDEAVGQPTVACIGPTTAEAVRACGWPVHLIPPDTTAAALVAALAATLPSRHTESHP
jgi:uroporphyrinogen-III synthase